MGSDSNEGRGLVGKLVSGGDDWAGKFTVLGADASEEAGLALSGNGEAVVGDEFDKRVGNVG